MMEPGWTFGIVNVFARYLMPLPFTISLSNVFPSNSVMLPSGWMVRPCTPWTDSWALLYGISTSAFCVTPCVVKILTRR